MWTAITIHTTTPGIRPNMHPVIALANAGVLMDELGVVYEKFTEVQRNSVVEAYPRAPHLDEEIIQTLYDRVRHKPETAYDTIMADVLAYTDVRIHGEGNASGTADLAPRIDRQFQLRG